MDASVVGMLISSDERAHTINEHYAKARLEGERLIAPTLLPYEVASLLRKKRVKKILSAVEVLGALRLFHDLKIEMVDFEDLAGRALALCETFGTYLTVYDASYLAVAEREKAKLWTADREFFRTVSPSFPDVELY